MHRADNGIGGRFAVKRLRSELARENEEAEVNPRRKRLREKTKFPRQINLIWVVQTRSQKYSPFQRPQISGYWRRLDPARGAYRDRHERGTGCGGRGSVGAQGDRRADSFRERFAACKTNGALPGEAFWRRRAAAYGKTVWSWHPLLVSSCRWRTRSNRVGSAIKPAATVTRRIRRRGERGISRKTIARGMPECFR
jgi:hypothetical protein